MSGLSQPAIVLVRARGRRHIACVGERGCGSEREKPGARMLRYLINFVYPPRCAGCAVRMSISSRWPVCERCLSEVERVPDPICQRCGIPIDPLAQKTEDCRPCTESPPSFGLARALTRYRPGRSEDGQVVA